MKALTKISVAEIQDASKKIMDHLRGNKKISDDPEMINLFVEASILGKDVFKDYLAEHEAWDFDKEKPAINLDNLNQDIAHIEATQLKHETEFASYISKCRKVVESDTHLLLNNTIMEIDQNLRGLVISYVLHEINKEYGIIYKNVIPPEIIWLMLSLAGSNNNEILCPFIFSEILGIAASSNANRIYNIYNETELLTIKYKNIENLSYVYNSLFHTDLHEEDVKKYDTTLAVLPQMRIRKSLFTELDDQYKSTSFPLQGLNKIISYTKNKIVALVSKDFLTSSGVSETHFKEQLLQKNLLDMVIELPDSTIPDHKTNYSIIVLNKNRDKHQNIVFFDASEDYSEPRKFPYKHNILSGWDDVLQGIHKNQHRHLLLIPADDPDDILADVDFSPKRHIYTKSYLQAFDTVYKPLERIAHLMRGDPLIDPESVNDEEFQNHDSLYYEASIRDIGPYNIVKQPEKRLKNVNSITKKRKELILKPHDILLSIKGIVGHVALVPDMGGQKWISNQSFQIIRVQENYDPVALFYQLQSKKIQHMITIRETGTTIRQIKIDDIKSLPIPILKPKQINCIKDHHREVINFIAKIDENCRIIFDELDT